MAMHETGSNQVEKHWLWEPTWSLELVRQTSSRLQRGKIVFFPRAQAADKCQSESELTRRLLCFHFFFSTKGKNILHFSLVISKGDRCSLTRGSVNLECRRQTTSFSGHMIEGKAQRDKMEILSFRMTRNFSERVSISLMFPRLVTELPGGSPLQTLTSD